MKKKRQDKIVELIGNRDIERQEDLAECLKNEGFDVTQATVSRDIKELKLTKMSIGGGRQKYILLKETDVRLNEKYIRVLRDSFISMDMAQGILVIKTVPGMAMAAAAALDAMRMPEIVGCIAGDDTIMAAVRSTEDNVSIMEKIYEMMK